MNQHERFPRRDNVVQFTLPGMLDERPLPGSLDVEEALLGVLLMNNDVYGVVARFLEPQHFKEDLHQRIYAVASETIRQGLPANAVTLPVYLGNQDLGGFDVKQCLARLSARATVPLNAESYARIIHDLWIRRGLISVGQTLVDDAWDAGIAALPADQIEQAQQGLAKYQVALSDRERRAVNLKAAGMELLEDIQADINGDAPPIPVTGIAVLDKEIALLPSSLVAVPGRTSMGKSIVGCELALSIARQGFGVVIHSLEMSRKQIIARLVSSWLFDKRVRIPYSNMLRRNGVTFDEAGEIANAVRDIEALPILIEDAGGRTIFDIQASSRRHANTFDRRGIKLEAVVIDHAHIVRASRPFHNDVQAIKEVTGEALNLCKELACTVFLLAQCNRGSESRDDKRPTLIDVRGGGSFEEDADIVLFPYRPAYHIERSSAFRSEVTTEESIEAKDKYEETKHLLQFIIDKNRAGRGGQTVDAWVDPALNAIRNLQREERAGW